MSKKGLEIEMIVDIVGITEKEVEDILVKA